MSYDPLDSGKPRKREQLDEGPGLFDSPPPPCQRHSDTSRAAALRIEPRAGTMRRVVLDHLRACKGGGATDEELQVALHMNPSTQRPRRIELEKGGLIRKAGIKRQTLSGGRAEVYVAVSEVA